MWVCRALDQSGHSRHPPPTLVSGPVSPGHLARGFVTPGWTCENQEAGAGRVFQGRATLLFPVSAVNRSEYTLQDPCVSWGGFFHAHLRCNLMNAPWQTARLRRRRRNVTLMGAERISGSRGEVNQPKVSGLFRRSLEVFSFRVNVIL